MFLPGNWMIVQSHFIFNGKAVISEKVFVQIHITSGPKIPAEIMNVFLKVRAME
jgi:hypothetical protein